MNISKEQLGEIRLQALFREHPECQVYWADSQINAHMLLLKLETLGWTYQERLLALQELNQSLWYQVAEREKL